MSIIEIDGSFGEGGGQVLRTALALSLVAGRPFHIYNIRAGRKKPGLMRQHLTAVNAAMEVGSAEVHGAAIGARELTFVPHAPKSGRYRFSVGSAGSCTLVLQTVLPALMIADGPTEIVLEGGTHNPFAPPFDFLEKAFLPFVNRMGPEISVNLERPGFYPAGGGRFTVRVKPAAELRPLVLIERGDIRKRTARGIVAGLPRRIAETETETVRHVLGWDRDECLIEELPEAYGPGNVIFIEIESENVTEIVTGFGQKGTPAEKVGRTAALEARAYLDSGVPVGRRLADQLMIPLALAGQGRYRTLPLSSHSTTNIEVIRIFLDVNVSIREVNDEVREIVFKGLGTWV